MPPFRKRGRGGGRKSPFGAFSLVGSLSLNSAQLVIELDLASMYGAQRSIYRGCEVRFSKR